MDILATLSSHLTFIIRFYDTTASPIEKRMRLIELGETPFEHTTLPEDFDGFEYQGEWEYADNCLRVLGQTGLALLAKALQDYLRAFFKREGAKPSGDGDWFKHYARLLEALPSFTWGNSPANYAQLEQIHLGRNNFMHGESIGSFSPEQDDRHFRKHPMSAFAISNGNCILRGEWRKKWIPFAPEGHPPILDRTC